MQASSKTREKQEYGEKIMTAFHTIAIPHDDILHRRVSLYILGVNLLVGFVIGRDGVPQEVEKSAEQGKLL